MTQLKEIKNLKQEFKIEGVKGIFAKVTTIDTTEGIRVFILNLNSMRGYWEQENLTVTPLSIVEGLKTF